MPLISLKQLLDHASEYNYGIPAFNISNLEQIKAVMDAANSTNSPVILQISVSAIKYAGYNFMRHLFLATIQDYRHLPICIHQDHGTSIAICKRAINLGCSSVMIDGSLMDDGSTPASYQYNVDITKKTVSFAHALGVSVEGELGCLGSLETNKATKEDGIGAVGLLSRDQLLTSVEEAVRFTRETKLDALAVAIGTSHGAYKFNNPPTKSTLALYRINEIHSCIPNIPLVLHGASSIPQNLLAYINKYGGCIHKTYGVPIPDIIEAIKYGVRKINIDTDLRIAATSSIRKFFSLNPSVFDPRQYNHESNYAIFKICKQRYEEFGSSGMAGKIKSLSLAQMSKMY